MKCVGKAGEVMYKFSILYRLEGANYMNEIKSIEIVLENCEAIRIDRENLGYFNIDNIKRSISRMAMNSVSDYLSAEKIFIQISSKANNHSSFIFTCHEGEVTPFDRILKYSDITSVVVNYENETSEEIYVDWGGDSDYTNPYQSVAINEKTNDLYIVISKNDEVHEFFKDNLEEEEGHWELYEGC